LIAREKKKEIAESKAFVSPLAMGKKVSPFQKVKPLNARKMESYFRKSTKSAHPKAPKNDGSIDFAH
jgi:hypothetical protein